MWIHSTEWRYLEKICCDFFLSDFSLILHCLRNMMALMFENKMKSAIHYWKTPNLVTLYTIWSFVVTLCAQVFKTKNIFVLSKMWMNFNPCEHLLHPIPLKLMLKKQNLMASILTASLSNKTRLTIMKKVSYQMSPCVLVFPTMKFSRSYS